MFACVEYGAAIRCRTDLFLGSVTAACNLLLPVISIDKWDNRVMNVSV